MINNKSKQGLADYYWSLQKEEKPPQTIKLPNSLPAEHPFAKCWSNVAGMEITPAPIRILKDSDIIEMVKYLEEIKKSN